MDAIGAVAEVGVSASVACEGTNAPGKPSRSNLDPALFVWQAELEMWTRRAKPRPHGNNG